MADSSKIISFIKAAEGGLSRATTDRASSNPAPWLFNGKKGWHTNRGITFTTFVSLAPKLGYEITPANFFNMPDSLWLKIFTFGYWTPMQLNNIQSQAIANCLADFAWASGVSGARTSIAKFLDDKHEIYSSSTLENNIALNKLTIKFGEEQIYRELIEWRRAFFLAIPGSANDKGWMNRMDALLAMGLDTIKKKVV
jgi:lysozyme family protein